MASGQSPTWPSRSPSRAGGVDKLAVHAGLGIPEVWLWRKEALEVWRLTPGRSNAYERRPRSILLPDLDLETLSRFVDTPNQTEAVRAFRDTLR